MRGRLVQKQIPEADSRSSRVAFAYVLRALGLLRAEGIDFVTSQKREPDRGCPLLRRCQGYNSLAMVEASFSCPFLPP